MFTETAVTVPADPHVELFVAQSPGPKDSVLLVIHGGPDWDHTYLREPLAQLGGSHRLITSDIRGCGRSTAGLSSGLNRPGVFGAGTVLGAAGPSDRELQGTQEVMFGHAAEPLTLGVAGARDAQRSRD